MIELEPEDSQKYSQKQSADMKKRVPPVQENAFIRLGAGQDSISFSSARTRSGRMSMMQALPLEQVPEP